jgi:ATP-dependent RNA helicase DeaD
MQVTEIAKEICRYAKLKVCSVNNDNKIRNEKEDLELSPDIVIGTQHRIQKHINYKSLYLSRVKYVVIDETDAVID